MNKMRRRILICVLVAVGVGRQGNLSTQQTMLIKLFMMGGAVMEVYYIAQNVQKHGMNATTKIYPVMTIQ
jgi:hypothetical protein